MTDKARSRSGKPIGAAMSERNVPACDAPPRLVLGMARAVQVRVGMFTSVLLVLACLSGSCGREDPSSTGVPTEIDVTQAEAAGGPGGYEYLQERGGHVIRSGHQVAQQPLQLRVRPGDLLCAFLWGYEIARVRLEPGRAERLVLTPASRNFRIRLAPEAPSPVTCKFLMWPRLGTGLAPLVGPGEVSLRPGRTIELPYSSEVNVSVMCEAGEDQYVIPATFRAAPGKTYDVKLGPTRKVVFECWQDGALVPFEEFFASLPCASSSGWTPAECDTLLSWIGGGGLNVLPAGEVRLLSAVPKPLPLGFVAKAPGGWVVGRVRGDQSRVQVAASPPQRALPKRILVGGQEVPAETLIFPGRLDVGTMGYAIDRGYMEEGFGCTASALGERKTAAAAQWLTLLHPSKGIAYVRWTDGAVLPSAMWEPGRIELSTDGADCRGLVGTLEVWPTLRGTGVITAGPAVTSARLRRRIEVAGHVAVLPGLPLGTYSLSYDLQCRDSKGRTRHLADTATVVVGGEHPATVRIRRPE